MEKGDMMKDKEKVILSFYESREDVISRYYDGRIVIIHKDSEVKVEAGDTFLCDILFHQKRAVVVLPIRKIDMKDIISEERLILKKDGKFVLVRNQEDRVVVDEIKDLKHMVKSELIGLIIRK